VLDGRADGDVGQEPHQSEQAMLAPNGLDGIFRRLPIPSPGDSAQPGNIY
jgi:hypothetical protein